ncbi:MAG TPA: hypothetical protein VEX68_13625 [Bryobacteraceae bacterium]|nr:hypothetical protein [Bryobacteraceae bacterium]
MRWKINACQDKSQTNDRKSVLQATPVGSTRTPFVYELTPIRSQVLTSGASLREASTQIGGGAGFFGALFRINSSKDRTSTQQSLQRDVLVAGAGKGLAEFGWDIMPVSQDHYVSPGVYTAFAILAVPEICGASLDMGQKYSWETLKATIPDPQTRSTADPPSKSEELSQKEFRAFESYSSTSKTEQTVYSLVDLPVLVDGEQNRANPVEFASYVPATPGEYASVIFRRTTFLR